MNSTRFADLRIAAAITLLALGAPAAASAAQEAAAAPHHAAAGEPDLSPDLSQGASSFDPAVASEILVKRVKTGHLLVRPVVNGVDAGWFIFDTGAGICVVSTPHVAELKLTEAGGIDTVGVGGATNAQLHRAATLVLGPLTLRDEPVMTTDLSFLKEHFGEEIVGVIGYGLLTQCIAEIDLTAPRIALHDPKGYVLAAGTWTPVSLDARVPSVDAIFEGHTGRFRLDTGANDFITFHEPAVREWKLLEGRDTSDAKLGGVGGFVAAKKGTLASFELCGVHRQDVPVEFALEAKGVFADSSRAGNIGAGFLAQFLLVVDYSGARIALRPRDGGAADATPDAAQGGAPGAAPNAAPGAAPSAEPKAAPDSAPHAAAPSAAPDAGPAAPRSAAPHSSGGK